MHHPVKIGVHYPCDLCINSSWLTWLCDSCKRKFFWFIWP